MASSSTSERAWRALFMLVVGGSVALAAALAAARSVGLLTWPPSEHADFDGWRTLFTTLTFWRSLALSVALALATLLASVSAALALCIGLGDALERGVLARVLPLPLALPPVVAALLGFVLLGDSGLVARLAHHVGLIARPGDFPALIHDHLGLGIVLTHAALVTPLFALLFARIAALEELPRLLALAAQLGASRARAWRCVGLPLLLKRARGVIAVYGLALVGAWEVPLLLGPSSPALLAVAIQRAIAGYDLAQRPLGYAMACVYLALLLGGWLLVGARRTRA